MQVRFLSFHKGPVHIAPPCRLILGHGYKDKGVTPHHTLLRLYPNLDEEVYASYLIYIEESIRVAEGGSESLNISPSKVNDSWLNECLTRKIYWERIQLLIPLVADERIPHLMISF